MATGTRVMAATLVVVLVGGAGYVAADAYDVVPGIVTVEPEQAPAAPFPAAPAAVEPAAVVPALTPLDAQAPTPAEESVQELVEEVADDERLGKPDDVGVLVLDQLTGEVLGRHHADVGRIPASTAKLATAVAALDAVDGSTTLDTRVVRGTGDEIVLVGGGDMMLAAGEGDEDAVVGHAGLADLAAQTARALRLEGATTVHLRVDDTLFTGPRTNPGWAETDLSMGFVAPVTALAVDIAKIREGEYPPRYPDPSMAAADTFAERLTEAGITVVGDPSRGTAPEGGVQLGVVASAPIDEIVHYFLETSDNTITEVVSRVVAIDAGLPASFEGGTQAVLRQVALLGVSTTGAHLADASGLADGSTLTPTTVADLLELVTDPAEPTLRPVAAGMPVGGLSGTLTDRYLDSEARGLVRAKTGSLRHVTGLAGTVYDTDGRQLIFVVLADATPDGGQYAPRRAIDGFVSELHGCGCG